MLKIVRALADRCLIGDAVTIDDYFLPPHCSVLPYEALPKFPNVVAWTIRMCALPLTAPASLWPPAD